MATKQFEKELNIALFTLDDIEDCFDSQIKEEISHGLERITNMTKQLQITKDNAVKEMLDNETVIQDVKDWSKEAKIKMEPLKETSLKLKSRLEEIQENEQKKKEERELQFQRRKFEEQQELERRWFNELSELQQNMKDKDIDFDATRNATAKPQTVKLQKYTITPFTGEYKDWIRFWNQFTVEVDGSNLAEISKFNY